MIGQNTLKQQLLEKIEIEQLGFMSLLKVGQVLVYRYKQ